MGEFALMIKGKIPDMRAELTERASGQQADKAIATLAKAVDSFDARISTAALKAIASICVHPPNHRLVMSHEPAIDVLVRTAKPPSFSLLSTPDPALRVLALNALANVSANPDYQPHILSCDAVKMLEAALHSGDDDVIFQGLRGLANLSEHPPSHSRLCTASVLTHLLSLATYRKPKKKKVKSQVATAEQRAKQEKENAEEERKLGLKIDNTSQVIRLITGLARHPSNTPTLHSHGVVRMFVTLAMCDQPVVVPRAVRALRFLAQHRVVREELMKSEFVEAYKLLVEHNKDAEVLYEIGSTFVLLLERKSEHKRFLDRFSHATLAAVYAFPDWSVKTTHMECMLELLKNTAYHHTLEDQGVVRRIRESMEQCDDADLVFACARSVQELCCEEGQRFRLQSQRVPQALCRHIDHDNTEVSKESLKALAFVLQKGSRDNRPFLLLLSELCLEKFETLLGHNDNELRTLVCTLVGILCEEDKVKSAVSRTGIPERLVKLSRRVAGEGGEATKLAASDALRALVVDRAKFEAKESEHAR